MGERGELGAFRIQPFGRALSTRLELDVRFRRNEAARLARLDDVIELHIREGDVDLLADESAVERWPEVLAELAAQVHDEIDPHRRIEAEHVAREIAANIRARFRFGPHRDRPDFARMRRYIERSTAFGDLGWYRDLIRTAGAETVLMPDDRRKPRIVVSWTLRRLLVDFTSPVPTGQAYDFFSVLDRSGTLVPVDPPGPGDPGLSTAETQALAAMLQALREVLQGAETTAYQRSMDQAHC